MACTRFILLLFACAGIAFHGLGTEAKGSSVPFVFVPPHIAWPMQGTCTPPNYSFESRHGKVEFLLHQSDETSGVPAKPRHSSEAAWIYPYQMLRAGIAGAATVKFTVEASGAITRAEIVKASSREFGEGLQSRFSRVKFAPAKQGNTAIRSVVTYEFVFTLDEDL